VGLPGGSADALARVYVVDRLAPGTSVRRQVEVINTSAAKADITIYVAAATMARGGFAFAAGHTKNALSRWTSVSRDMVLLAPGADAFDTVSISVPGDASSGQRYAVVWAQLATAPPTGGGVELVNRVGVRMYVSVGPVGASRPNFTIGAFSAGRTVNGRALVDAEVHNTGQTSLDIRGDLTLSNGPGGLRTGPLPAHLATGLAPGGSELATVTFSPRFPSGPWRAYLLLTSGLVQKSVLATISFPPVAVASPQPAGPSPLVFIAGALACLLALAAVGLLVQWRRASGRRRRQSGHVRLRWR
jgi:hypothetical protein